MSERRYDPTHGEWVTFATDRQDRTYKPAAAACPLGPTHPGGPETEIPRERFDIAVFENRFPSLSPHPPASSVAGSELVCTCSSRPGRGRWPTSARTRACATSCRSRTGARPAFLTDVAPEVAAERLRAACAEVEVAA